MQRRRRQDMNDIQIGLGEHFAQAAIGRRQIPFALGRGRAVGLGVAHGGDFERQRLERADMKIRDESRAGDAHAGRAGRLPGGCARALWRYGGWGVCHVDVINRLLTKREIGAFLSLHYSGRTGKTSRATRGYQVRSNRSIAVLYPTAWI